MDGKKTIQRDISANMRRSVEACLEVGRGLAVLKAACGHGNFVARLDVLKQLDIPALRKILDGYGIQTPDPKLFREKALPSFKRQLINKIISQEFS